MQVRKAEKVRTVQRVKKTVLMKQTVRVRQPGRRKSIPRPKVAKSSTPEDSVDVRRQHINASYGNI